MGPVQAGGETTTCRANHRQDCRWKRGGCHQPPIPPYGRRDRWEGNATSGIHRGDELKACRIAHMRVCSRDDCFAGFDRLPKRIQDLPLEFGQFVEEEYAEMRKRNLSWLHAQTA